MADFELDSAGIAKILKSSEVRHALHAFADPIAQDVRSATRLPVNVTDLTTDRAVVRVSIDDPLGGMEQARNGVLTRAAGNVGLTVKAHR